MGTLLRRLRPFCQICQCDPGLEEKGLDSYFCWKRLRGSHGENRCGAWIPLTDSWFLIPTSVLLQKVKNQEKGGKKLEL